MSLNPMLFLVSGLNILIGWYVFQKNAKSAPNQAFCAFAVGVGLWTLGIFFAHNEPWAHTIFARLPFISGSLIPFSGLALTKVLLPGSRFRWEWDLGIFGVIGGLVSLLSFTPLVGHSVELTSTGIQWSYGPLYPLFALYFSICFAYGFLRLIRQYWSASGLIRLQLRDLILGLVVPGVLATITNVLIPFIFGSSRFSRYGPLFSLLMVVMIGHAIIRHRLMDIRVVIKKGVVYTTAFVVAGAILAGLIAGANALFPRDSWALGREILLGLVVAVLFHPLKGHIQRSFDTYLYRGTYDYQQILREAIRRTATMLDLRSLLRYLCDVIGRAMRPEMTVVYLRDLAREEYGAAQMQRFTDGRAADEPAAIHENSALPQWLQTERTCLVLDDLGRGDPDPPTRAALDELIRLGGALAFPIWDEERLNGFLIVGPKLSGDPYFAEDTDLLFTLTSQAAIAIKNAQLYQEVVLVNEYIDNILKTMESGVVAVSVEHKVTLFNPAAERMTGLEATTMRGAPLDQLPTALAAATKATLADGQPRLQLETTISGITGRMTPVICSTSPFRGPQGNILGAVLVFSDLTRLKELEGEKRRAEQLASIGAVASGIAHEIKNPLVAIRTFAQLLPRKFAEESFREEFAKIVVQEIDRIQGLAEHLNDLSRPSEEPLRPLDLREPIEANLELLHGQLEEKQIAVRRLYPVVPFLVAGDPDRLKQLFLNLFQNSLQAMLPGGELTIRLDNQEEPSAPTLHVEVSDTGSGIPEALLGKIFDPFVTTKPRGAGLGLAISRAIAHAHGATIRAENSPHRQGAIITLEFPAVVSAPEVLQA